MIKNELDSHIKNLLQQRDNSSLDSQDPLPWLIQNLRHKHQGAEVADERRQVSEQKSQDPNESGSESR